MTSRGSWSAPSRPVRLQRAAAVPEELRGQPGIFTSPEEWKARAYIVDDETRARLLPVWKEWFTAHIVR